MAICAVHGCSNRSDKQNKKSESNSKVSFYRFPRVIHNRGPDIRSLSEERLNRWISQLRRKELNTSNVQCKRVCSKHFLGGKPAELKDKTHPDWAPVCALGYGTAKVASNDRYIRAQQRNVSILPVPDSVSGTETVAETETVNETEDINDSENFISQVLKPTKKSIKCQTDLTLKKIKEMETELLNRNKDFNSLKEKVNDTSFNESTFANDNEKVSFYTGLPSFSLLMVVFNELSPFVKSTQNNVLNPFQEFVLFLMRLRLNAFFQDLSYRFGISTPTASRIFSKWLEVAYVRLKKLVRWPGRRDIQKTMPTQFITTFGDKVAVILDCFEIFIDRPSSLVTRAATWSNYKSHNTVKVLIGITPQGVISFISNVWGGRASDQYITEHSGILDNLRTGDLVLADRGFKIEESVGLYCAELILPAFTRGKNRLTAHQIQDTRKIASLRIHVERVIGNIRRKYTILKGHIPVETLTTASEESAPIDKIVHVCCSLTNLSPSVVPIS